MATRQVRVTFRIGGVLTDPTSAVLRNALGTAGIVRDDTGATVVAASTAMVKESTGKYVYSFVEPVVGIAYTAYVQVTYNGNVYRLERALSPSSSDAWPTESPETLPHLYTTQEEIERWISRDAAESRIRDLESGAEPSASDLAWEQAIWDEICASATDEVNFYLLRFYETVDLAANLWVRQRATWIGVYLLSQRRGDPGLYQDLYLKAMDSLAQIDETHNVPRLRARLTVLPAMSNLRVDDRFRIAKQRVEPVVSTGGTSSRQNPEPDYIQEPYP